MELTINHAFVYGAMGSLAVELVLALQMMGPRGGIPPKYRTWTFWILRVLLTLCSGGIATAYFAPQLPALLYVHIGAATPVILTRASRIGDEEADNNS